MDDPMHAPPTGRGLVLTFVALVVLAGLSWVAAAFDAGSGVAIAIASVKALAIALVFMELTRASPTDRVIAVVAVMFVVLICAGALTDVAFR
jgi:caa(3)-type oxidase subunit IV